VAIQGRTTALPFLERDGSTGIVPSRSDPFAPFFAIKGNGATGSPPTLGDIDLREVRLTAILRTTEGNASASIETPQGHSFLISVGSIVGVKRGRVLAITPTKVVISESTSDNEAPESTTFLELRSNKE
jgi:hypothetical protein